MPQLDCLECVSAAAGAHYGFRFGCGGCDARMLARGPHFFRVRKAGRLDSDYIAAIERVGVTHAQVKEAAVRDALCNVPREAQGAA
jgi:hypothetical protein